MRLRDWTRRAFMRGFGAAGAFARPAAAAEPPAAGRRYFVANDGDDSGPGTEQAPWRTLARVNRQPLQPGDTVLLRRGDIWRERLAPPASGTRAAPITFAAYGAGARPLIKASEAVTRGGYRWFRTGSGTNEYYLATAQGTSPRLAEVRALFVGGAWAPRGRAGALPAGAWDWEEPTLPHGGRAGFATVVFRSDRGDPDAGPTIEAGQRDMGIEIDGLSFLRFQGLACRHGNHPGRGGISHWVVGEGGQGLEIVDCELAQNLARGFWSAGPGRFRDLTITGCIVTGNAGDGISVTRAEGGRIAGNVVERNCLLPVEPYQAGIRLWAGVVAPDRVRDVVIERNEVGFNRAGHARDEGIGIHVDECGPGIVVRYNVVRDCDDAGIEIENMAGGVLCHHNVVTRTHAGIFVYRAGHGHRIYNNTIFDVSWVPLVLQGERTGTEMLRSGRRLTGNAIKNNIALAGADGSLRAVRGGENDGAWGAGNVYAFNCFGPGRPGFIEWGAGTRLDRYAAWESAYGETGSVMADPGFVDPARGDFRLRAGSPCIDAGTAVDLGQDPEGVPLPRDPRPNLGAY